jgi:ABC-2 type transport system ATP-binding protein
MTEADRLVVTASLKKSYSDIVAVNDVSLEINAGEIYALVGANGAGKSTLFRMLTGLTVPDEGQVTICGHDMRGHSVPAKRCIGYLPEELYFYQRLSGREYLSLVAGLKETNEEDVESELEFFELTAVHHKQVGGYSLGMRKKLGLAAAFIANPRVLVLDEPLNGLDVEMMRKLRLRLEAGREEGRAIVISSHVMSFVERISTRVGVMRAGMLVAEGTPVELREFAELSDAPFEDVFFRLAK